MTRRDVLKLAWANLQRMRARVALTAIGVIIGTAAVIILISLGVGLQTSAEASIGSAGDLTVIQVNSMFSGGGPGQPQDDDQRKFDDDTIEEIRQMEHVIAVTPMQGLNGGSEYELSRDWRAHAYTRGLDADSVESLGWEFEEGVGTLSSGQVLLGAGVFEDDRHEMVRMGPGGSSSQTGAHSRPAREWALSRPPITSAGFARRPAGNAAPLEMGSGNPERDFSHRTSPHRRYSVWG